MKISVNTICYVVGDAIIVYRMEFDKTRWSRNSAIVTKTVYEMLLGVVG